MGKQAIERRLEDYSPAEFNVLHPVVLVAGESVSSPVLVQSVSVVRINTAPDSGEVYHDWRFAPEREGKAALSALGLAKIAAAAGIKWVPELCRVLARERRPDGHIYIDYQAGGAVRQPNGEWHIEVAHKDIDTADVAERLEDAYTRKLRDGRAKYAATQIPEMVRRDLLQVKEFLLGHAETKAKNRVIRRLLTLRQVYSHKDLERPFAVPRLLYRPDLTDPMQLEQVQIEGRQAAAALYGSPGVGDHAGSGSAYSQGEPERPELQTSAAEATVPRASGRGGGSPEDEATAAGPNSETQAAGTPARGPASQTGSATSTGEGQPERAQDPRPVRPVEDSAARSEPDTPAEDPFFSDGPYKGLRMSEVAEKDPGFLRGLAAEGRNKRIRTLAQDWLSYYNPTLA